ALSDVRRPAPLGALLEGQLSGTLLTWVLELVVLTLLGMRAIADDRRSGAWELLLTARVGEGAAVVGKWVAAVVVYALLWVPTLGPAFDHPTLANLLEAVGLRETALVFARGEVAVARVVLVGGLAVAGLSLAITLACAGRRRRSEVSTRALATVAKARVDTSL